MINVLATINPFDMINSFLAPTTSSKLPLLISIVSGVAFIAILWQVFQIMGASGEEKVVAKKKSNIIKILIAYAVIILIPVLIATAKSLSDRNSYPTGGSGTSSERNYKESELREFQ